MQHPRTVMTFSDAGAHVSQISDVSIQTHLLAYWVRERQAFTLEEAVRMITLVPATAWGLADRGLVREGFVADLNVFDPDRVGPELPTVQHDLPAGARRLVQKATGFRATVVGGEVVLEEGEHTGAPTRASVARRARRLTTARPTPRAVARRCPTRANGGTRAATARPPSTRAGRVPVDGCQRSASVPSWNVVTIAGWTYEVAAHRPRVAQPGRHVVDHRVHLATALGRALGRRHRRQRGAGHQRGHPRTEVLRGDVGLRGVAQVVVHVGGLDRVRMVGHR